MTFKDSQHQERYLQVLGKMRNQDNYHQAAAYLMALVPLKYSDVFDFESDGIKHEGIYAAWQTHSSRKATRLMFNLWNGCCQDYAAEEPEKTSTYYTVEEIFGNYEYAPYFYEAVRILNGWV